MECTITSSAPRTKTRNGGFTLLEAVVAGGLSTIVLAAIASYGIFSSRSFTAIGNYVLEDMSGRNVLDTMSRDIRQADGCDTNAPQFTSTNLTLLMTDPTSGQPYTISYNYYATNGTLTRTYTNTVANVVQTSVLLTNCSSFAFSYYQRTPANGTWDAFPVDTSRPDECKVVQMSWSCTQKVLGRLVDSEGLQSAKVVIRKE